MSISLQHAAHMVGSIWPPTSKGESGWSFICDPVPRVSDYFENSHTIQFVPKMLKEKFAEAFRVSCFLHLTGEVFSEFHSVSSLELLQSSSFQHEVVPILRREPELRASQGHGLWATGLSQLWNPSNLEPPVLCAMYYLIFKPVWVAFFCNSQIKVAQLWPTVTGV